MSFRCSGADHLGLPQSHRGRSRWLWPPRPWTPGLALVALRWTLMEHQIEGGAEDSFPVGPQVFHCLVWQYGLQKRQDELPKSPSSSLAETLAAKESSGSQVILPIHLLGAGWTRVGSAFSLISRLVWDAKLLRWPPLSGTRRQRAGKQNKRSHEN